MNRVKAGVDPLLIWSRFTPEERRSLRRLAQEPSLRALRLCVHYLRWGTGYPGNRGFIFELCDKLISDPSVRWTALSTLGDYAESHPKELWPLVLKWGSARSKDIRNAVHFCVVEHILEYHFSEFFPKAAEQARREPRFAETLGRVYKFGQLAEPENSLVYDNFFASLRSSGRPRRARRSHKHPDC